MLICRRCKREFTPLKNEARCNVCLTKRRANRETKRKDARESRVMVNTFERMMRGNGERKGHSNVRMLG